MGESASPPPRLSPAKTSRGDLSVAARIRVPSGLPGWSVAPHGGRNRPERIAAEFSARSRRSSGPAGAAGPRGRREPPVTLASASISLFANSDRMNGQG